MALEEEDIESFLSIHAYLTQKLAIDEMKNILINEGHDNKDVITGLKARTNFGRPNWDKIFSELRNNHSGADIGVFFCGPKALSKTLHKMCNKYTEATDDGTRFYYSKGLRFSSNFLLNIFFI